MNARLVLGACALVVLLPACAVQPGVEVQTGTDPTCLPGRLVLIAQSVPSAQKIPCIAAYPAGWTFEKIDVHRDKTTFSLDSDRSGSADVRVTLREECDVGGATEIPTDEDDSRRYERIEQAVGRYVGDRFYVFEGGCVTYHFDIDSRSERLALANEATNALTFMDRSVVADHVADYSDGRFTLDP